MAHVEVDFAGETFTYDPDSLLMSELQEIKRVTGMGRRDWNLALLEDDVEAVLGLVFILRKRRGDDVKFSELDGPWSSFAVREVADPVDEKEAKGRKRPPLEAAS